MVRLSVSALALAAAAIAQPAAAETRTYDVAAFDRIDVSAGLKVVAAAGGKQKVTVETDMGDYSDFQIEVDDGVLIVSREWNGLRWRSRKADYTVFVTAPSLKGLEASAGSHASVAKVDSKQFLIDISSGAYAEISGKCGMCIVDLSSGAALSAVDLVCDRAEVEVSSGGHGQLSVLNELIGDASSGGHAAIYGNPQRVAIDRSSGGQIKVKPPLQAKN
ncbi:MAG: DUF2807 domain-containing protein [Parvularculaceae bacterium]